MMEESEHRNVSRDSMFLSADITVGENKTVHQVRVRNLSAGGMKAEGNFHVALNDILNINISNIGDIPGKVVWVKPGQFGVAFDSVIDPQMARKKVVHNESNAPRYIRPITTRRVGVK